MTDPNESPWLATDGAGPRRSSTHWGDIPMKAMTVGALIRDGAVQHPDRLCLIEVSSGQRFSYAEVDRLSDRLAAGLHAHGIAPQAPIGVMMDNSVHCLLCYVALAKLGAVTVPINTAAKGAMLERYVTVATTDLVICDAKYRPRLRDLPRPPRLVVRGGAVAADAGTVDLADLLATEAPPPPVEPRFSDLAYIMFTSGTGGPSKPIAFTHAAAIMWERSMAEQWSVGADDIFYLCIPASHAAGLFGAVFQMFAVGGAVAVAGFSASRFLVEIRASGATLATLLGAMVAFVEQIPAAPDDACNPLRLVNVGPFPSRPLEFQQRFGIRLSSGYGLSDFAAACKFPPDAEAKYGSCGRPVYPYRLRIVDGDDITLPPGTVGEIVLRSEEPWRTASGYHGMPEASLAAQRNGWFHTGDLGYLDDDGFLWLTGRAKEVIRRRGENISALEVEQALLAHPDVAQVAAYAVPSEVSEDEVCVAVVAREGAIIDPVELIHFCIGAMPHYMVPRFVRQVEALPYTHTGRVEKYKLRDHARDHRAELWDREQIDDLRRVRND
jgi:crotonobetaine/carnitine-CoA ligase